MKISSKVAIVSLVLLVAVGVFLFAASKIVPVPIETHLYEGSGAKGAFVFSPPEITNPLYSDSGYFLLISCESEDNIDGYLKVENDKGDEVYTVDFEQRSADESSVVRSRLANDSKVLILNFDKRKLFVKNKSYTVKYHIVSVLESDSISFWLKHIR